jgi:hypothetical protein
VSRTAHRRRSARRTLLGRFPLSGLVRSSIDETGLLDVTFSEARSDAMLRSLDGNRSLVWVAPSGAICSLLVQDYSNGETRRIPFAFGELEVVDDGTDLTIFLRMQR